MIKLLMKIMSKFYSKLESPVELGQYDIVKEVERSDDCYCGSNKKYKHCHREQNLKKNQIAITITDTKTNNITFKLVHEDDIDRLSGISKNNIGTNKTFSLIEMKSSVQSDNNLKN
jgi:hypothetical protein